MHFVSYQFYVSIETNTYLGNDEDEERWSKLVKIKKSIDLKFIKFAMGLKGTWNQKESKTSEHD